MKKAFFAILLAVVAFAATSCSTTLKTMKEPVVHFQLNSSDYVLSEQFTGEATVTRVFGIDWARIFTNRFGAISTPIFGVTAVTSLNDMYAVYDLLDKHPGYDFVMYPQYTSTTSGIAGLFEKTTIKVTARLGKMR